MSTAEISGVEELATPAHYECFDKMLIGGEWREGRSARQLEDENPYTGERIATIRMADKKDLDDAYRAADKARDSWLDLLPGQRAEILRKAAAIMDARKDEIVNWIVTEAGGTRLKAEIEWQSARDITLEASSFPHRIEGKILPVDYPGKESRVYRKPVGVVGVISPWNFPLHLSNRSVAPALACGNTVVLKPASDTPITGALLLAKMYEEAGLPTGVLNVVIGAGSEIGDDFVTHPIPRMISFTGSTEVGRNIGALANTGKTLKKVALELGGNGPLVLLDDADLDWAAGAACFGKFLNAGQVCMSINRIIVDARIHDDFVDRFMERVRKLKVGDPADPETAVGPVINRRQLDAHLENIRKAREEGARQLLGEEPQGLVLPPYVFTDVRPHMQIARTEQFGPIASILKANGDGEALRMANDTSYGLSSSVFSADMERAVQFAQGIETGMTHVNDTPVADFPNNPFGAEKNSGVGRFGGEWAIHELTTDHWITVQHTRPEYPF